MIAAAVAVGLACGVLSGMGVGGGTLLMVFLTAVAGIDPTVAAGYNLLYFLCCAPSALISHWRNKHLRFSVIAFSLLGGIPGVFLAQCVARAVSVNWLHRGFGILLILVGLREVFCHAERERR